MLCTFEVVSEAADEVVSELGALSLPLPQAMKTTAIAIINKILFILYLFSFRKLDAAIPVVWRKGKAGYNAVCPAPYTTRLQALQKWEETGVRPGR